MKRHRYRSRIGAVLVTLAVGGGLAAFGPGTGPAEAADTTGTAELIVGTGSDAIYELMQGIDIAYNRSEGCRREANTTLSEVQRIDLGCHGIVVDPDGPGGTPCPNLPIGCTAPGRIRSENWWHDTATSLSPLGSGNGRKQLCNKGGSGPSGTGVFPADYSRSSSSSTSNCPAGTLQRVAIAKEAIPPATFPGTGPAATTNFTLAEIQGIWNDCTILDWRQVAGSPVFNPAYVLPAGGFDPDGDPGPGTPGSPDPDDGTFYDYTDLATNFPIQVYTAQDGSGTRNDWDGFVPGANPTDQCIPTPNKTNVAGFPQRKIFENNAAPIVGNGEQANAAFYYGSGSFTKRGGEGILLRNINGIAPIESTIIAGTYPFSRFVYIMYGIDGNGIDGDGTQDCNPAGSINFCASAATLRYMHPRYGWICKPNSEHGVNPKTGINYGTELRDGVIRSEGFFPLPLDTIGGSVSGSSHCRGV